MKTHIVRLFSLNFPFLLACPAWPLAQRLLVPGLSIRLVANLPAKITFHWSANFQKTFISNIYKNQHIDFQALTYFYYRVRAK